MPRKINKSWKNSNFFRLRQGFSIISNLEFILTRIKSMSEKFLNQIFNLTSYHK